ncbi:MAG: phosphate starvation-inducible protein PsiF [Beijerinckiaceae bacterium]|nr:MAG: phosphate starvation-inducible protein PsiF [Beijerinckiaceae bacterium]
MKTFTRLMIAGALFFGLGQFGYAQTTAPAAPSAPAAPAAPAVPKAKKAPMSAEDMAKKAKSKECSAKADEQKLHGKARKEFREKCKNS